MKIYIGLAGLLFIVACGGGADVSKLQADVDMLTTQNDSLTSLLQATKPSLGDLMMEIQVHHNKLWFAGKESNWPLAQFEHDKMMQTYAQAQRIETDRPEIKLIPVMIYPQLRAVQTAITKKDSKEFEQSFTDLTNGCNSCHKDAHYPWTHIKIPDQPPFSNQDFAPNKND